MCYELAAFRVTIHVLTTLAVFGTVALGCPLEGALLLVLFATAHKVEEKLSLHAAGDLRALWASVPAQAQLVRLLAPPGQGPDFDSERACASDLVPLGALLLVRAGQPVPLDGVVVHGGALLSMEHLTGEAAPVAVGPGDEVPAGAHNADGLLVVRATRSAADSTPARIASPTMRDMFAATRKYCIAPMSSQSDTNDMLPPPNSPRRTSRMSHRLPCMGTSSTALWLGIAPRRPTDAIARQGRRYHSKSVRLFSTKGAPLRPPAAEPYPT